MKELFRFLIAAVKNPHQVGAVSPASRFLARRMVDQVSIGPDDLVVELGPGMGAITHEILPRLASHRQYIGIDLQDEMLSVLRTEYPHLRLINGSAENLVALLEGRRAAVIFSSLPWSLFSHELQERILNSVVASMTDSGVLVAYAYTGGLWQPRSRHFQALLRQRFTRVEISSPEWLTFPPATIFTCRRS